MDLGRFVIPLGILTCAFLLATIHAGIIIYLTV